MLTVMIRKVGPTENALVQNFGQNVITGLGLI